MTTPSTKSIKVAIELRTHAANELLTWLQKSALELTIEEQFPCLPHS